MTVPKCVSCFDKLSFEDCALCPKCLAEYYETKAQSFCSVCLKPLYECSCTNDYLDSHFVHKVIKVLRYKASVEGVRVPAYELVYNLKRGNRRDIVKFLSEEIAESIRNSLKLENKKYIITNVPRQRSRRIKYGVDHSKELAKAVGKILDFEYLPILKSKSPKAQKKTHGEERITNAKFDYKNEYDLKGENVIILDDIITTGASVGTCATLLKGLGARSIIAVSFAVAYKDNYTPFLTEDRFS